MIHLFVLAAGGGPAAVAAIDYSLPPPPALRRATPGSCRSGAGDDIVVCGRRDRDRAIATLKPLPGVRPPGHAFQLDLGGGAIAEPVVQSGYQDGWPDKRVMVMVKVPF